VAEPDLELRRGGEEVGRGKVLAPPSFLPSL